jgi:hypothetical protein
MVEGRKRNCVAEMGGVSGSAPSPFDPKRELSGAPVYISGFYGLDAPVENRAEKDPPAGHGHNDYMPGKKRPDSILAPAKFRQA